MKQSKLVEFIQDRLYYGVLNNPQDDAETHYFSTDATLVYLPFEQDFGPLNLGQAYAFFAQLSGKLKDKNLKTKRIVYYSGSSFNYRANSVTLLAMFMVCVLNRTPEDIHQILQMVQPPLTPFRDACMGPCSYGVTVMDVVHACKRSIHSQLFSLNSFKYDDYYFYSQVENGDLTWIIPQKILAFAGPVSQTHPFFKYHPFTPQSYIPLFQSRNVTAVVRLNEACYNRQDFIKAGIHHYDLPYPDGSIPPEKIVQQFLQIVETEQGAVAVHCKAGLGRTGTLIGLHMMKRYGFTARETIAWLRVLRPGSVLGQQQQYLIQMDSAMRPVEQQLAEVVIKTQPTATNQQPMMTQNTQSNTQQYGQQNQYMQQQNARTTSQLLNPVVSPARNQISQLGFKPYNSPLKAQQQQQQSNQQMSYTQPRQEQMQPAAQTFNQRVTAFNNSPPRLLTSVMKPAAKLASPVRAGAQSVLGQKRAEPTMEYGFGANGRVHPDVVRSPVSRLNAQLQGLPGIRTTQRGKGNSVLDM